MVVVRKKSAAPRVQKKPAGAGPSARVIKKAFNKGTQGVLMDQRRESDRRKRLAHLISVNLGQKKPRPLYELCIEAGYSESTAKARVSELVAAAKDEPEVQNHLERLKRIRDKMLKRIEDQADRSSVGQLGFPLQVIEKSIALLENRPTDRIEHTLTDDEQEELDDILEENE